MEMIITIILLQNEFYLENLIRYRSRNLLAFLCVHENLCHISSEKRKTWTSVITPSCITDDDAGYYPALKCKPHAAGCPRDSNSGSHYCKLIRILRINRKLIETRRIAAFINYPRLKTNLSNRLDSVLNEIDLRDCCGPLSALLR